MEGAEHAKKKKLAEGENAAPKTRQQKQIEREEEKMAYREDQKQCYHLCIVNLVIGTLYCAKGNFEFGVSRVIKSLEPYNKKLSPDTWFYAKRCFLALIDTLAKHMMMMRDAFFHELVTFLEAAGRWCHAAHSG